MTTDIASIRQKHFPGSVIPKRSKYGNKKTILDGMVFDSKAESRHWAELKLRERAGEIRNLKRQVLFNCGWNGVLICRYVADFVFEEKQGKEWNRVIADTKGFETALFRLKAKVMLATHDAEIRLLKARR